MYLRNYMAVLGRFFFADLSRFFVAITANRIFSSLVMSVSDSFRCEKKLLPGKIAARPRSLLIHPAVCGLFLSRNPPSSSSAVATIPNFANSSSKSKSLLGKHDLDFSSLGLKELFRTTELLDLGRDITLLFVKLAGCIVLYFC